MANMQINEAVINAESVNVGMKDDSQILDVVAKNSFPTIVFTGGTGDDVDRVFIIVSTGVSFDYNDRFYKHIGSVNIDETLQHIFEDITQEASS